jgi:small-conductance mechanosensitive channel
MRWSDALASEVAARRGLRGAVAPLWRCVLLLLIGLLASLAASPLDAQEAATTQGGLESLIEAFPEGLTPEQLDAVLAVTDDGALRAALRERLLAEMAARDAAIAPGVETTADFYGRRFDVVAATYPRLPAALAETLRRPLGQDRPVRPVRLVLSILFALAVGGLAMFGVRRLLAGRRAGLSAAFEGGAQAVGRQILRLALDVVEIAAFLLGILIGAALLRSDHPAGSIVLFIVLQAALVVLLVDKVSRLLCGPDTPDLRLIPLGDSGARALHRTILVVVLLTVLVIAIGRIFWRLGMDYDALAALTLPLSVLPYGYLLWLIWRHRARITETVAAALQLDPTTTPFLRAWPVVATAYLVGLWLVVAGGIIGQVPEVGSRALASLLVILAVPIIAWLIHRPIARFYGLSAERPLAPPSPAAAHPITDEYGDALPIAVPPPASAPNQAPESGNVRRLMRAVWLVLLVLAVVGTAWIWGFDPARHVGFGGVVVRVLFDIGVVLLLGYVGWALLIHAFNRVLKRSQAEGPTTRAQRMATLLPLARKFLQVVLIAIIVMIVLSSLGINIGPLLAGAGVVGLAVGLGSQQTIADIVAGVFFLVEDAFRVGDYVETGNIRGTVENISLRSLKLRHHRGAVHTLPFGQIKSLTNYTRDWALMRLEFRLAPETDLALIKRLVKNIGNELLADPEMGPNFIEPLKSQGIRYVEDGAIVIGVKYIAKPQTQFTIRREAYQRIITAFKENGIEMVGRGVVVRVEGPEAPGPVAGAAAAEAVRQQLEQKAG